MEKCNNGPGIKLVLKLLHKFEFVTVDDSIEDTTTRLVFASNDKEDSNKLEIYVSKEVANVYQIRKFYEIEIPGKQEGKY